MFIRKTAALEKDLGRLRLLLDEQGAENHNHILEFGDVNKSFVGYGPETQLAIISWLGIWHKKYRIFNLLFTSSSLNRFDWLPLVDWQADCSWVAEMKAVVFMSVPPKEPSIISDLAPTSLFLLIMKLIPLCCAWV